MSGINEQFLGLRPRAAAGGSSGAASNTVRLGEYTASNDTSVDVGEGLDLDAIIDGTYDKYLLSGIDVVPATNLAELQVRTSGDGATFDSTAGNYQYAFADLSTGTVNSQGSASATEVVLLNNIGNDLGEAYNFEITIYNPAGTTVDTNFYISSLGLDGGSNIISLMGGFLRAIENPVLAVRLFMSTGNIQVGKFTLDGVLA